MKHGYLLLLDSLIIILATAVGVILRDNFEFSYTRIVEMAPFFVATVIASVIILSIFGTNRLIWRFSALPAYLRLVAAMAAITIGSLAIAFAFNRLDGVPRSLPFLQFNLSITLLIGLRVLYKLHYYNRSSHKTRMTPLKVVEEPFSQTVLLVGLSRLTETYLQSVSELARGRVRIAGILAHRERHVGRLVASYEVIGIPEHIGRVVSDLKVNGVVIDKILITAPSASFSPAAHKAIAAVERSRSAQVIYLSEKLGFDSIGERPSPTEKVEPATLRHRSTAFAIQADELKAMQARRYWTVKRTIDVVVALLLLIMTLPIMAFVAICISATIGRPFVFWQQRPGLGGRPFRLYKFRTMNAAYTSDGRELSDDERMSRIGNFLRRTRLDELPQLFNIVLGDMSFIGPRPLLPRDQDDAYRARLLLRPGLTGWAQVVGGRAISAEDKAALDVWYVRHASLLLDLKVVLKTIPIVLFGETISRHLIERAWSDLREAGVLRGRIAQMEPSQGRAAA